MAIWIGLLIVVVAALRLQSRFFAADGKPIAKLSFKTGHVQSRSEELVTWKKVDLGNGFFEGDRVATGMNSRARITFSEGREITLGEDSQIMITAIQQGDEYSFIVNLLKGSVEGSQRVSKNRQSRKVMPLQIKSGSKVLTVESGKPVGLLKPVGAPAREYVPPPARRLEAAAVSFQEPGPESKDSLAEVMAASPIPLRSPTPPVPVSSPVVSEASNASPVVVQPRERAKAFAARLTEKSKQAKNFMVLGSFSTIANEKFDLDIRPPPQRPENHIWRPAVIVWGERGDRRMITGQGFRPQALSIPLESALRRAVKRDASVGQIAEFSIRGGAVLVPQHGGKTTAGFDGPSVKWTIHSISEGEAGGITVALDRLLRTDGTDKLIPIKPTIDTSQAPYVVKLRGASQISKLKPYLLGAERIGFKSGGPGLGRSVFIAAKGKILAELSGSALSAKDVEELTNVLDGDFAFRGPQASMFDTSQRSGAQLLEWMETSLDQGRVIQIMRDGRLFPINREFIQNNVEVAEFVGANARAVFVDQVEIIHNRK